MDARWRTYKDLLHTACLQLLSRVPWTTQPQAPRERCVAHFLWGEWLLLLLAGGCLLLLCLSVLARLSFA